MERDSGHQLPTDQQLFDQFQMVAPLDDVPEIERRSSGPVILAFTEDDIPFAPEGRKLPEEQRLESRKRAVYAAGGYLALELALSKVTKEQMPIASGAVEFTMASAQAVHHKVGEFAMRFAGAVRWISSSR